MIGKNGKINNIQLFSLMITMILGAGFFSLASEMARRVGTDGWILIILSGVFYLLGLLILLKLANMYPGKTIFQYGKEIVHPYIFNVFTLFFLIYYICISAVVARVFGEVIKGFLLENTPIEFTIITMLLTVMYSSRSGIESLGRIAVIIFIIMMLFIVIFSITLFPGGDYTNIFPVFRHSIRDFIKNIGATFFSFLGYDIVLVAFAYVDDMKEASKSAIKAFIFVIICYLLVFFIDLIQFGVSELKYQVWPSISILREIDFPGVFIQNLDGIFMTIWILTIFGTLSPMLYSGGIAVSSLYNSQESKYHMTLLLPIIYVIALIPKNLIEVYKILGFFTQIVGAISIVLVPIILLIVSAFKNRKKQTD